MKCLLVIGFIIIQTAAAQNPENAVEKIIKATVAKLQKLTERVPAIFDKIEEAAIAEAHKLIKNIDLTKEESDEFNKIIETLRSKLRSNVSELLIEMQSYEKELRAAVAKCFEDHPSTSLLCATKEAAKIYANAITNIGRLIMTTRSRQYELIEEALKAIRELIERAGQNSES